MKIWCTDAVSIVTTHKASCVLPGIACVPVCSFLCLYLASIRTHRAVSNDELLLLFGKGSATHIIPVPGNNELLRNIAQFPDSGKNKGKIYLKMRQ